MSIVSCLLEVSMRRAVFGPHVVPMGMLWPELGVAWKGRGCRSSRASWRVVGTLVCQGMFCEVSLGMPMGNKCVVDRESGRRNG